LEAWLIAFDWDDANIGHIARHGIAVEEVESALNGLTVLYDYDDGHEEQRVAELGMSAAGRFLIIWTTLRGSRVRVITAFDAPRRAVQVYLESRVKR
jgi:uncharacterized DUF497 family protein